MIAILWLWLAHAGYLCQCVVPAYEHEKRMF